MSIPKWQSDGLLPPIRPGRSGTDADRSPYETTALEIVLRFGTTIHRCAILDGWLRHRQALYTLGMVEGHQWVDGSFVEEVELTQDRPPEDIDVVTFFELPEGVESQDEWANLDQVPLGEIAKVEFCVDAYYQQLGQAMDRSEMERVTYWYSMWSHSREGLWKGFVSVPLDPDADQIALDNLKAIRDDLEGAG